MTDYREMSNLELLDALEQRIDDAIRKRKEQLSNIVHLGHNDDCLFCGLKDKEALRRPI